MQLNDSAAMNIYNQMYQPIASKLRDVNDVRKRTPQGTRRIFSKCSIYN